jgi:tetratricopeptide (TPR) repeat protein
MRRLYRSVLFSALLAAGACGSTAGQVYSNDDTSDNGGAPGGDGRAVGFDDGDFTRKDVTEVKAPVYLQGIDEGAQDAFRDGVRAVSAAKPDLKLAEKKFREAADKAPDFLEAYFNWGQTLERQGKGDDALNVYQKALDKNPGDASATAYIAKIYLGKARTARFLGNEAEASKWMDKSKGLLDALVSKDPTNVQVNNSLALYFLMKDDVDAAEKYVKEVLFVEPSNVTGLNTRGLINLKRGKLLLAKWVFENKVLREDPSSTEALTNLGYTYIKLDQRPLAMRYFQDALDQDPENMEVRMNIAAMLLEHLDYAHALGHYDKILAAQPTNAEAKIGRCDALYGAGGKATDKTAAFTAAVDCYDAFAKDRPERADLLKRIADTYQNKLQNLEKAVEYYELYGKKGNLSPVDADKNQKMIMTLKEIIANGGLKALEAPPEEPAPGESPEVPTPDGDGGN